MTERSLRLLDSSSTVLRRFFDGIFLDGPSTGSGTVREARKQILRRLRLLRRTRKGLLRMTREGAPRNDKEGAPQNHKGGGSSE